MPSLAQHSSLEYVKALYLGDPGSGKTGSLDSLVGAGYQLRIYDYDNLLGSLTQYVLRNHPDLIDNVRFQTFTDQMEGKAMPVTMIGNSMRVAPFAKGVPTAFVKGLQQMTRWKTEEEDLGDPGSWGKDTVVVIDSLTNLAQAAYRYAMAMNPAGKEGQVFYGIAQSLVLNTIQLLFSEQMATNVLVLAHIDYRENEFEIMKGFPRSIGQALNSQIAAYFNCVLLAQKTGQGQNIKRTIKTNSTGVVDLKNPVSFKVDDELPLESGLATFFKAVTGYSPADKEKN
jgi:hypothetical protein